MPWQVNYGCQDKAQDKGYAGVTLPSSVTTLDIAQAVTFANAVLALSDAGKVSVKVINEDKTQGTVTTGDNAHTVEFRGEVIIRQISDPSRKWPVAIPAIKNANIDPNGSAVHKVSAAAEAACLAAFATLSSIAASDLEITGSFIKGLRKGAARV